MKFSLQKLDYLRKLVFKYASTLGVILKVNSVLVLKFEGLT